MPVPTPLQPIACPADEARLGSTSRIIMITEEQAASVKHRKLKKPSATQTHLRAAVLRPGYAASMANIAAGTDRTESASFGLVEGLYNWFNSILQAGLEADPSHVALGAFAYGESDPLESQLVGFILIERVRAMPTTRAVYKLVDFVTPGSNRWRVTKFLLGIWTQHCPRCELVTDVLNRNAAEYLERGFEPQGSARLTGQTRLVYRGR